MKAGQILFITVFNIGFFSVTAWDLAVAVKDQIQLLDKSGTVAGTVTEGLAEVSALAYNLELRQMYFSDNDNRDGSIFRLTVPATLNGANITAQLHTVVSKQVHKVMGMAYDDMTGILYWSNGPGHAILWVQISTVDQPQAGQPLVRLEEQIPMGIAIDTCKRTLYWTNCQPNEGSSVERSQLDGSGRQSLVHTDLHMPYAVVVDQEDERLYWVDARYGNEYRIESSDLHGNDRKTVISGSNHQPFALAVNTENVFWADHIHRSVWSIPLMSEHDGSIVRRPQQVFSYSNSPQALASARTGVWTSDRCNPIVKPVMKVIPATVTKTVVKASSSASNSSQPQVSCFNKGVWQAEGRSCDCLPGYSGMYCEVDECLDYCVHGSCRGDRTCDCYDGFRGKRCEIDMCYNYCVTGSCSIDLTGQPQCHCKEGYAGDRCQVNYTAEEELKSSLQEVCQGFCKMWALAKEPIQPYNMCSCPEFEPEEPASAGWSRDHIILLLIALLSIAMVTIAVLCRKNFVLRKQPRIKKRIIVNKSVTPLTCRPSPSGGEQCEITIENCCNMNICETPCFEPDFRQPGATLSKNDKGGKEEKKTLLGNMELPPDDLY